MKGLDDADTQMISNIAGIKVLFEALLENKLVLDKSLLYYGVKEMPLWVNEKAADQIFVKPTFWADLKDPVFGEIIDKKTKNKSSVKYFESYSPIISKKKLEEHIDFKSTKHKKLINIEVCQVPLNLEPGSKDSLEFLDVIAEANDEALYQNFAHLINYKWKNQKKDLYLTSIIYTVCVVLIDIYACFFKDVASAQGWYLVLIEITCFMILVQETRYMLLEGVRVYFSNLQNYFDLIGFITMILYCIQQ